MKQEVQTLALLSNSFAANKNVLIPNVVGKTREDMWLVPIKSIAELETFPLSAWGIPEPPRDLYTKNDDFTESGAIDLIIVPGVAFDSKCKPTI